MAFSLFLIIHKVRVYPNIIAGNAKRECGKAIITSVKNGNLSSNVGSKKW
jgi:hypothetical protein